MEKTSTLALAALLMTLTSVGQTQPYLSVKSPSGVPYRKLELYLDSNRIRIQDVATDTAGKVKFRLSRLEVNRRPVSDADRSLLRNYLRDSFQTSTAQFLEIAESYRRVTGVRLERPLVELSVRVFEDSVDIGEGDAPRISYALGDSAGFIASARKIYDRSASARQMLEKCMLHPPAEPPVETFPTFIALAALALGILIGILSSLFLLKSMRKKDIGSGSGGDTKDTEPLSPTRHDTPQRGQGEEWTVPSSTLELLMKQLSAILSNQKSVPLMQPIRSEDDLRSLLENCKKFVEQVVGAEVDLRKRNDGLTKQILIQDNDIRAGKGKIVELEGALNQKTVEAGLLRSERNDLAAKYDAEVQKRMMSEAKVEKLEEDEKAMAAIASKVRSMLDELYVRIDAMTAARRPNEEFEAEVLHAFMSIAVVSLSHFSIRAGRYIDADRANIDLLEGRSSVRPALRVDASTSRNSVDTVAYFVYQLLKAHNVQALKGFNCMGYSIGS